MIKLRADETDDSLVIKVLSGDREAFSTLASRYSESVLRLCVRLLSDPVEAQDVAQEALLQAFLGLNQLQQPGRFGAWLHAIAANLSHSILRRGKPMSMEALEAIGQGGFQRTSLIPHPEQVVAARETHDAIVSALMDLSTVNREAVVGYYVQGYSYAELASLLGVPVSTIKSRLFKGRQQLRLRLAHLRQPARFPTPQQQEEIPMRTELIPLQIETICEYALTQRSILVLRTLTGDRYLPIKLLLDEAAEIERALKSQPAVLPLAPQDTLLQLASKLGGRMEQVILRSLAKQNYYASLVLVQDGQSVEVDCRLSDALVLAVHAQIPILCAPATLEETTISLEAVDFDPVISEAELPDPREPVTVSDAWPDTFVEQVWSLLLNLLSGHRTPYDLSRLRGLDWDRLIPTHATHWEGQSMQVVRLPGTQPAWLVVQPGLWSQIKHFVEWVQQRDASKPVEQPLLIPLSSDRHRQVEQLLEEAWPPLSALGAHSLALMHLGGRLLFWKSRDTYETAARMGQAAVRDVVLTRHLAALVNAAAEPAIKIMYERSAAFDPARAAGNKVVWTNEALIHNTWLLVTGWSTDQQHTEEQQRIAQVGASLAEILPG